MNDPNANDPKDPTTEPKPISSWGQGNENQTPAYNDPDNWNRYSSPEDPTTNYQAQPPTPETASVNPETPLEQNYQTETQSSSGENSYEGPIQETQPPAEPTGQAQPDQPQEQHATENPMYPPKSKSNMGLMIIMVTVVIILTGATALLAFQNYQLRSEKASQPTPTPISTPTPTPDPTADWEMYTNEEYGFEFKLHPEWEVRLSPQSIGQVLLSIGISPKNIQEDVLGGVSVLTNSTVEATIKTEKDNLIQSDSTKLVSEKEVVFAGQEATELMIENNVAKVTSKIIVFEKNNLVFRVFGGGSQDNTTIDLTLSTFKFIEEVETSTLSCSTGYEKFSNANFSFCYPAGMKETAASTATSVVLENSTDTLKVAQNFQGGWGGSPCLAINSITVAKYPSKRLSWKTENTDGTCGTTYTSFATMVNEGVFSSPFPYMMELTKKTGNFPDNTIFTTIESSFVPAATN